MFFIRIFVGLTEHYDIEKHVSLKSTPRTLSWGHPDLTHDRLRQLRIPARTAHTI